MPAVDISQPLVKAGASVENNWAAANAETSVDILGGAALKRGLTAEIGISAAASANAGLSKFIAAQIGGNAYATARVRLVAHTPLNLFEKCGVEAAVEAIAEAAAGVSIKLGLKVGDFIQLAKEIVGEQGLPLELILLLLEETEATANVQARAAAAAKAHAAISLLLMVTGSDPSLQVKGEAGVGLAAGAGFGFKVGFRFVNFRRYFGRAVDKSVNTNLQSIRSHASLTDQNIKNILTILAPVSKALLRLSYEVADFIATQKEIRPGVAENLVAQKAVQIIVEEIQRFVLQTSLQWSLAKLQGTLLSNSPSRSASWWTATSATRASLLQLLQAFPTDLFTEDTAYFKKMIDGLSEFFAALPNEQNSEELKKTIATLFSATLLCRYAIENKLVKKDAYAMAIGAGTARFEAETGFRGKLTVAPNPALNAYINLQIQRPATSDLSYPHLVSFLITDHVLDPLLQANPFLTDLAKLFEQELGTPKRVLCAFMESGATLAIDNKASEQEVLKALLAAFDFFISQKIKNELLPRVRPFFRDEATCQFFEEAIVGTLFYMKGEIFSALLDWRKIKFTREQILEALSGVLTNLLGRSFVVTADVLFNAVMTQIQSELLKFGAELKSDDRLIRQVGLQNNPAAVKILQTGFKAASTALQPIDAEQRKRFRNHLYNILQPIPLSERSNFLTSLQRDNFIPDLQSVEGLTKELKDFMISCLGKFLTAFTQISCTFLNEAIEALLTEASVLIERWKNKMEDVLQDLIGLIWQIDAAIKEAQQKIDAALNDAYSDATRLLRKLKSDAFAIAKKAIVDGFFENTEKWANSLNVSDNAWTPVVNEAQVFRDARRAFLSEAKKTISDALGTLSKIDKFFDGVLDMSDDIKDRLRKIDLRKNIEVQVSDIFLDALDKKLKDSLGRSFSLSMTVGFPGFSKTLGLSQRETINLVKDAVRTWSEFTGAVHQIAVDLQRAAQQDVLLDDHKLRKSKAEKYQQSVVKIKAAQLSSASKAISIVSPVEGELYHSPFTAEVQFIGVSTTYLGLSANEQQQIFVHLNGRLLKFPDSALQVSERKLTQEKALKISAAVRSALVSPTVVGSSDDSATTVVGRSDTATTIPGSSLTVADTVSAITIRFTIRKEWLRPGMNNLLVSIREVGGKNKQSGLYFLYTEAANASQRPELFFPPIVSVDALINADKQYLNSEAAKKFAERI